MVIFNKNKCFLNLKIDFKFSLEIIEKFISLRNEATKPKQSVNYYNLIHFPNNNIYFQSLGIDKEFSNYTSIQCNIGRMPPHTDIERRVSLLCPVFGLADTVFYHTSEQLENRKLYNEDALKEICREQFKIGGWYLFNNQQVHNVENMTTNERIGLTINLNPFYQSYNDAINNIDKIIKKIS